MLSKQNCSRSRPLSPLRPFPPMNPPFSTPPGVFLVYVVFLFVCFFHHGPGISKRVSCKNHAGIISQAITLVCATDLLRRHEDCQNVLVCRVRENNIHQEITRMTKQKDKSKWRYVENILNKA